MYKIYNNEFIHEPELHKCGEVLHKCGFQCIQCGYFCTEEINHVGLHRCAHGNINNSFISVSDLNYALVKKEDKYYKFKEGETAKVFFCDQYCREQGQGHIHLFKSHLKLETDNQNIRFYKKEFNEYIYECKCPYYWEKILKFKGNFTKEDEDKFNLCNWECNGSHPLKEFCQLKLWHEEVKENIVPKGVSWTWISKGHVFKCNHPTAVYTIFLVDQSGSMNSNSIIPTRNDLSKQNMIGASIEAILSYCDTRKIINPKDCCSLIGFNDKASLIFEDMNIGEIDEIKNKCISELKPDGFTLFKNSFEKAKTILDKINRVNYIPIIILLTDGLDHGYEDTIDYIENELIKVEKTRENSCKIFCIYFKNKEEQYNFGKVQGKDEEILKKIAELGETQNLYNTSSLSQLCNAFIKISDTIQTNYKLKLNKKI